MTFRQLRYLPNFVLITIPASESANPLLLPLAGHELGHRVWTDERLDDRVRGRILSALQDFVERERVKRPTAPEVSSIPAGPLEKITALLKRPRQAPGLDIALANSLRQAEELFCDLVGYYIFGESFLHAFAYLLAPKPPQDRRGSYPDIVARVNLLLRCATKFNTSVSPAYTAPVNFADQFEAQDGGTEFWTKAADVAASSLGDFLIDTLVDLSKDGKWKDLPRLSVDIRNSIVKEAFYWGVPAANAEGLGNILNAAWDVASDSTFWDDCAFLTHQPKEKRSTFKKGALKEIALKSIEVLDYEQMKEDRLSDVK